MKTPCPACNVDVEVVLVDGAMIQLDTMMIEEGEIENAIRYQMHTDGTATNLNREDVDALAEGKQPKSVPKFRIEHRNLCPDGVTVTGVYMLTSRLQDEVLARGEAHATEMEQAGAASTTV